MGASEIGDDGSSVALHDLEVGREGRCARGRGRRWFFWLVWQMGGGRIDLRAGEGRDASALVLGLVVRGGGGSSADKRNGDETRAGNEVEFTVAVAGDRGDTTANE